MALEAERVYQHLTNKLYTLTMVKLLGPPSIDLAVRAMVFMFLRNPQLGLSISKTPPYLHVHEDSLTGELADLWTVWNSLTESLPRIQADVERVKSRVLDYNSQANYRLAVAREYVNSRRLKAADAVLVLKVVYCNNDIGLSAKDAQRSTAKKTERTLESLANIESNFSQEYLAEVAAHIQAMPPTSLKQFMKKCRDLPGGFDQTILAA